MASASLDIAAAARVEDLAGEVKSEAAREREVRCGLEVAEEDDDADAVWADALSLLSRDWLSFPSSWANSAINLRHQASGVESRVMTAKSKKKQKGKKKQNNWRLHSIFRLRQKRRWKIQHNSRGQAGGCGSRRSSHFSLFNRVTATFRKK
jgi:hypothetical protein